MMAKNNLGNLLLSSPTRKMAEVYLASPTTALLITGAAGSGKFTLARAISAGLLQDSADHLDLNPNFTLFSRIAVNLKYRLMPYVT